MRNENSYSNPAAVAPLGASAMVVGAEASLIEEAGEACSPKGEGAGFGADVECVPGPELPKMAVVGSRLNGAGEAPATDGFV